MVNPMVFVWQAQGVLMARHGVDADEALELLRSAACTAGRCVAEEARLLVEEIGRATSSREFSIERRNDLQRDS